MQKAVLNIVSFALDVCRYETVGGVEANRKERRQRGTTHTTNVPCWNQTVMTTQRASHSRQPSGQQGHSPPSPKKELVLSDQHYQIRQRKAANLHIATRGWCQQSVFACFCSNISWLRWLSKRLQIQICVPNPFCCSSAICSTLVCHIVEHTHWAAVIVSALRVYVITTESSQRPNWCVY